MFNNTIMNNIDCVANAILLFMIIFLKLIFFISQHLILKLLISTHQQFYGILRQITSSN